jgi:RimJ/RimL family protein N-acetyltransferase
MDTCLMLRVLRATGYEDFHLLRTGALVRHPNAYSASPGEDAAPDEAAARERMEPTKDQCIASVFRLGAMVGMPGLVRMHHQKLCHHANVWGACVPPDLRGQGHSKSLLRLVLAEAQRRPGLEQLNACVYANSAAARQVVQGAGFGWWGEARRPATVEGACFDEEHYTLRLVCDLRDKVASFDRPQPGNIWQSD